MQRHITQNDVPDDPDERRIWALLQLRRRGKPLRVLAKQEGVYPSSVWIAFRQPSARMEEVIARELGLTAQELFPERFAPNGSRIHTPKGKTPEERAAANG